VTITRVAFFTHWTCTLTSMQWCILAWAGTLGYAVHTLLSKVTGVTCQNILPRRIIPGVKAS